MRHAITIAAALAALSGAALAQAAPESGKPTPGKQAPGKPTPESSRSLDEAMPDVDPGVLAQCRDSAATRNLKGSARDQFIRACIEPED
ncbi:hypothetical protein [Methylobacterium nigriterrae]|uniref:hypothetical protein n=1 Tax=Methylobacterium nigriterrae TaxID=3127512 RepID=UPI003013E570